MKTVCEVVVSYLLPTIRSLIANELINKHNLSQIEVSKKLGITKAAVCQYKKGLRGRKAEKILSNKKILNEIKKLAKNIAENDYTSEQIHIKICKISEILIKERVIRDKIIPGPCLVRR
jgi:hypothetical protein